MARTKKHHYLPQGYLRGFSHEGREKHIWQITKAGDRQSLVSIGNAGCESDFNTVECASGASDSTTVERELSKVEGMLLGGIRRIASGSGSEEDHALLCMFVSLMQTRVPYFKRYVEAFRRSMASATLEMLGKEDRLEQSFERHRFPELAKYPPQIRKVFFDRCRKMVQENRIGVQVSNAELIRMTLQSAFEPRTIEAFAALGWTILEAPVGRQFVLSDQPVAIFDAEGRPGALPRSLFARGVETTVALNSQVAAKLRKTSDRGTRIRVLASDVTEINRRTIIMAERYIFAPTASEELTNLTRENANNRAGSEFRMITLAKGDRYVPFSQRVPVYPAARYAAESTTNP